MTAPAEAVHESHWDRSVKALIAGTFLSTTAHLAGVTALGKLVFDLTGRELDLGLIGLAEFLPVLLLVLVAGSVADRVDRRLICGVGALVSAAVAAALAAYAASRRAPSPRSSPWSSSLGSPPPSCRRPAEPCPPTSSPPRTCPGWSPATRPRGSRP